MLEKFANDNLVVTIFKPGPCQFLGSGFVADLRSKAGHFLHDNISQSGKAAVSDDVRLEASQFVFTVYGSYPSNAMLTVKPEAGPVINHLLWRSRVQEIGMRLRDDIDIVQETNASGV
jgi:hypothetical protein